MKPNKTLAIVVVMASAGMRLCTVATSVPALFPISTSRASNSRGAHTPLSISSAWFATNPTAPSFQSFGADVEDRHCHVCHYGICRVGDAAWPRRRVLQTRYDITHVLQ